MATKEILTVRPIAVVSCVPAAVKNDWQRGVYSSVKISFQTQLSPREHDVKRTRFCSNSIWSGTGHDDRGLYAHSNQVFFEGFCKGGDPYAMGGKCHTCRQDFTHRAMGVPIEICFTGGKYRVKMIDICCSFNCTYSWYLLHINLKASQYGTLFRDKDSYTLLERLFHMMVPEAREGKIVLREANDFRLLASNGGSLSSAEYWDGSHRFTETGNLVCIPTKLVYRTPESTTKP